MERFGALDSSEKTIAVLGDRWWPQTAKQETDETSTFFLCVIYGRKVLGAQCWTRLCYSRSWNDAVSLKGCVGNG